MASKTFSTLFWGLLLGIGIALTAINVYGKFQHIRPTVFFPDELRFKNDISLSYEQTIAAIKRQPQESEKAYAARITHAISQGLAHIKWNQFSGSQFNQLIPIWENYFLYFMGKFSGIPEFEKYHFANYQRSLQRGIGICGDAAMIMSQLLDKEKISNQLLTFPGHVITTAKFSDGTELLYDADFGVTLPYSAEQIRKAPWLVDKFYEEAGYTSLDIKIMNNIYGNSYKRWNGVKHFITKKYYFEYITYSLKWPLPIVLILISVFMLYRNKKTQQS
jgi:hypothetical protein